MERTALGRAIKRTEGEIQRRARRLIEMREQIKTLYQECDKELEKITDMIGRNAIEASESAGVLIGRTDDDRDILLKDNFAVKAVVFRPVGVRRFDVEVK